MGPLVSRYSTIPHIFGRIETLSVSLTCGLPILVDKFLQFHSSTTRPGTSPTFQTFRLVRDLLIGLPLFGAEVTIADLMGLQLESRSEIFTALFPGGGS